MGVTREVHSPRSDPASLGLSRYGDSIELSALAGLTAKLYRKAALDQPYSQRYAVATDDRKLIRLLRAAHVAFVVPGIILYSLKERGLVDEKMALRGLDQLADFISEDEYSTVRLLLEEKP